MALNVPGNILNSALEINSTNILSVYTDTIGQSETVDNYLLRLNNRSSLNLQLSGLSADADVEIIQDKNNNYYVDAGEVIASSTAPRHRNEYINTELAAGEYYIRVVAAENIYTDYQLSIELNAVVDDVSSSIPIAQNSSRRARRGDDWLGSTTTNTISTTTTTPIAASTNSYNRGGTLGADRFTYERTTGLAVFSGNGNVDFGGGSRDTLDLKTAGLNWNQLTFNWATSSGGGVAYNPGNGNRIFDSISISDGGQIYFEGIERIEFADGAIDLSYFDIAFTNTGLGIKGNVITNDERFNQQWNLHMTGVHNAWRFTTGSTSVRIGIEDSGLSFNASGITHPDLRFTYSDSNNIADESTDFSHGTQINSTISSPGNNFTGIAGINWGSEVQHIDVLGGNSNDYDLASATQRIINDAIAKGQKVVINLSLSGGESEAFRQLINNNQGNALFVMAAGNGNTNSIVSPGNLAQSFGNVMSVGSSWGRTDWYGNAKTPGDRANYSNWWGSNYLSNESFNSGSRALTIMAPTEFVAATSNRDTNGNFNHSYNDKFNGTSASTAMVTGIASLVWGINPNLTAAQVKDILSQTAYDLGTAGYDQYYGNGFINADAAVRRALALARGVG